MGIINVGFSYPWSYNRYGAQIGPNPHMGAAEWAVQEAHYARGELADIKPSPTFDFLGRNLKNLKGMGFDVIRWFLLGDGLVYGAAPTARPTASGGGYEFAPPNVLDKRFELDFLRILEAFKSADLQLLPSMIDFRFAGPLQPAGPNGQIGGGRADVINDPDKRRTFLDSVLGMFLSASKAYSAQIFAWEVMNEPYWSTVGFGPLSNPAYQYRTPEVTSANMSNFLNDAIDRIKSAGFESTVGHRFADDLKAFPTGSIRQFHYYGQSYRVLPTVPAIVPENVLSRIAPSQRNSGITLGDPPTIPPFSETQAMIGEIGLVWSYNLFLGLNAFQYYWPELPFFQQNPSDMLRLLEAKGYRRVLYWPDALGTGSRDNIKLINDTRRSLTDYTGGVVPPAGE